MNAVDKTLARIHTAQKAAFMRTPFPSLADRRAALDALKSAVLDNQERIAEAISEDFGARSVHETRLVEIFGTLQQISGARRSLKKWMRPRRKPVSFWFLPGRAKVMFQPLGVVGIISPWNFPLFLAAGPLAYALAAGNRVMVKMSEYAPRFGALFEEIIGAAFPENHVAVVNGGVDVAAAFSRLPLDHILFTGSTETGRKVMRAASENLTPVTLELGGKSPVIIHRDFPVATAAGRLAHFKCISGGQVCVAPDYVLAHEDKVEELAAAIRDCAARFYPSAGSNPDYTSIVNDGHYQRLQGYIEDARRKGAEIVMADGAPGADAQTRKMPLVILLNVTDEMKVMHNEIFGPILPVVPYRSLDEAIAYVNARPRPLALYYFDHDSARVDRVLHETVSGGVTVNDTMVHVLQNRLPFGGVGPSGMGQYQGREGFETFSKKKSVFYQPRINGLPLFRPPYGRFIDVILKLMIR